MNSTQGKVVTVGICGLGRSGYGIHCNALKSMQDTFKIKGVYDPLEKRAEEVAGELNATNYSSLQTMLGDSGIELVVIASPNKYHKEQVIQALDAGKHVLCEKPFGLTLSDVDSMIQTSQKADKILQPFQQRRYEHDFLKVKEICESIPIFPS